MDNSRNDRIFEGVDAWAAFYRANPHRFAADYLRLNLKLFQKILLYVMNKVNYFCYIAARGQGKSYLLAVFCCIRCILYPGTKVCIASGTRGQSVNILEKIQNELVPKSPLLKNEIVPNGIQISGGKAVIIFKNTSYIKVVTARDSARGNRANILLVDEFRMVDQDTINTILKKFLTTPRMPGYIHMPEYSHLKERNKEIYLSSAYFKSHWSYQKFIDYARNMLDENKKYFVCSLPYQLSIAEGLLDPENVADEMAESDFNEIKFNMEMNGEWWGDTEGSFFDFDNIAKNRTIQYPMLPDSIASKIQDNKKLRIQPKANGEIRILSVDLALMSSAHNHNDASAIFIDQCIPTKSGRYISNIIYTESSEGEHTVDQALRIRRLHEIYSTDYIVIDVRGVGLGVADALIRDIVDPDTGEIYPALSCYNNEDWANRCASRNAPKVLWVINASDRFNSDCAVLLREGFKSGKIRLPVDEYTGAENLEALKGYSTLDTRSKLQMQLPYIHTTLLIDELINLQHDESSGYVHITRKSGMRKDRYSSLSYCYYVACQLESKIKSRRNESFEPAGNGFYFRAPKSQIERR